jgi:hypothetical protein
LNNLTPDLRLLLAPSATYRSIAARPAAMASRAWMRVVARALIPAAIAGIATTISATGRMSWSLAASGVACWSFLTVLQAATAAAVVAPSVRGTERSRALDLFFLGHAAWSLWLLIATAAMVVSPRDLPMDLVFASALVPLVGRRWSSMPSFVRLPGSIERRPSGGPRSTRASRCC